MSQLIAAPEILATAATDLEGIRSAVAAASSTASGPTTGLLAAAQDEVSAAVARLFALYGEEYQAVLAQTAAFQTQFNQLLAAASNAYANADAFGAALATPAASQQALILGWTGSPVPALKALANVNKAFIQTLFPDVASWQLVPSPEQFWPVTPQLGNLTFGQSVARGVASLDAAIKAQWAAGNSAVVFGYSQGATIVNQQIYALMAAGSPHPNDLSFVLAANPHNPNGGLLTRFPGFYIPWLDVSFTNPTPPNSPYATSIYTAQYDGVAHAPQYPLNILSDINAIMGYFYVHNLFPTMSPGDVLNAVPLPTSPGYAGETKYYMIMTQNLPLLQPIRDIPYVGPVIADLFQPQLRVLVDLGYSDYGPTGGYADIPTPAGLFAIPNPLAVGYNLIKGSLQAPYGAAVEIGVQAGLWGPEWFPQDYPWAPSISPGLHIYTGQPQVTLLSQLSGGLGDVLRWIQPPVFPE